MTSLVERLRNRIHDAPMPTEHMLDEAADTIEALCEALRGMVGCKCPQCNGWGEIAYFGEMVGCPCGGKFRHAPTDEQINKARAALAKVQS